MFINIDTNPQLLEDRDIKFAQGKLNHRMEIYESIWSEALSLYLPIKLPCGCFISADINNLQPDEFYFIHEFYEGDNETIEQIMYVALDNDYEASYYCPSISSMDQPGCKNASCNDIGNKYYFNNVHKPIHSLHVRGMEYSEIFEILSDV